jgi:hypothetical protein
VFSHSPKRGEELDAARADAGTLVMPNKQDSFNSDVKFDLKNQAHLKQNEEISAWKVA